MRKYVTLDQRECVHVDASFHHDNVPECLWPSSSLVRVLEYTIDCIDYVTGIGNLHMRSTGTHCYGYRPSNG